MHDLQVRERAVPPEQLLHEAARPVEAAGELLHRGLGATGVDEAEGGEAGGGFTPRERAAIRFAERMALHISQARVNYTEPIWQLT